MNLLSQVIRFGIVGGISFIVDWLTGLIFSNIVLYFSPTFEQSILATIAAAIGFTVSVIVNYLLSFKFVFNRREDLNRKYEFILFIFLSIIGLAINSFLIFVWMGPVYNNTSALQQYGYNLNYTAAKIFATAVVMVYNFITRKVFLEEKKKAHADD